MAITSNPSLDRAPLDAQRVQSLNQKVGLLNIAGACEDRLDLIANSFSDLGDFLDTNKKAVVENAKDLALSAFNQKEPQPIRDKADEHVAQAKHALDKWKQRVLGLYPELLNIPEERILAVLGTDADPSLRSTLETFKNCPVPTSAEEAIDGLIAFVMDDVEASLIRVDSEHARHQKDFKSTDISSNDAVPVKGAFLNAIEAAFLSKTMEVFEEAKQVVAANLNTKVEQHEAEERKKTAYVSVPFYAHQFVDSLLAPASAVPSVEPTTELFKQMRDVVANAKGLKPSDTSLPTDEQMEEVVKKIKTLNFAGSKELARLEKSQKGTRLLDSVMRDSGGRSLLNQQVAESIALEKYHLLSAHLTTVLRALGQALQTLDGPELTEMHKKLEACFVHEAKSLVIIELKDYTGIKVKSVVEPEWEPEDLTPPFGKSLVSRDASVPVRTDAEEPSAATMPESLISGDSLASILRTLTEPSDSRASTPALSVPPVAAPRLQTTRRAPESIPAPAPVVVEITQDADPTATAHPVRRPTRAVRKEAAKPIPSTHKVVVTALLLGSCTSVFVTYKVLNGSWVDEITGISEWLAGPAEPVAPTVAPTQWGALNSTAYPTFDNPTTQWVDDLSRANNGLDISKGAIAIRCVDGKNESGMGMPATAHSFPITSEAVTQDGGINWLVDGCEVIGYEPFSRGACVQDICESQRDGYFAVALTPKG